jgi:hypothetical protein
MNMQYGVEKSEKWFVELWNYTLQPYLNNMIKMRLVNENPMVNMSQQDPYEWILKNYVWPRNATFNLNQRLFKLNYYNNYLANRECSSSSNSSSDESVNLRKKVSTESNDSNQQLVSLKRVSLEFLIFCFFLIIHFKITMLKRLQKATSREENSSGFYGSSNSSLSNSPTVLSCNQENDSFESHQPVILLDPITTKSKIESSL